MSSIWRSPSHHMVSGASVTLTKLLWGRVHEKLLVENELKYVQIYNQYLYYQVWEYQEAVCFYWLIWFTYGEYSCMWVFWILLTQLYVPAETERTQIPEECVVTGTSVVSDVRSGVDEERRRPSPAAPGSLCRGWPIFCRAELAQILL